MILTGTSAWIEYFRATGSTAAGEVRRLLATESERVVICEPIAMEILAGALDEDRHVKLERLVDGLKRSEAVPSMPGVARLSLDLLLPVAETRWYSGLASPEGTSYWRPSS